MKFIDPLATLQYMGGSFPIHFVLLIIGLLDYNYIETDILCATSDNYKKY